GQVSLAAPYPGTALYAEAVEHGWLVRDALVGADGTQQSPLGYPGLPHTEIYEAVPRFYRRFYFRPGKLMAIAGDMVRDREVMKRRLREGREFLGFLSRPRAPSLSAALPPEADAQKRFPASRPQRASRASTAWTEKVSTSESAIRTSTPANMTSGR